MTAHAMNGDKERCLEAGMNGYISKPVHPSLLLSTVDEFLLQKTSYDDGILGLWRTRFQVSSKSSHCVAMFPMASRNTNRPFNTV